MHIEGHFDPATSTISYLVLDTISMQCALIDPLLDYDAKSGRTSTVHADRLAMRATQLGCDVQWLLETHVHADHLSAGPYLKSRVGGRTAIGARVLEVLHVLGDIFDTGAECMQGGSRFDTLLEDGETFRIGALHAVAMHTPGHTPACMTYVISGADETVAFVGDTLFMPDYGTARCDFPGGNARQLYRSIRKVLSLPVETRLYTCHDYQPDGRALRFVTTVAEQRESNVHVRDGINEEDFVSMREARDATLSMPALFLPSVQVNMRAGQLPSPEANGIRYLKIPLNTF